MKWEAVEGPRPGFWQIKGPSVGVSIEVPPFDVDCSTSATREAEARLIASAPELLEALVLMVRHFTKSPSSLKDSEARGKAHAAIKKATGVEA